MTSAPVDRIGVEEAANGSPPQDEDESVSMYTFETVLKYTQKDSKDLYLVKWLGYPMEEATWEPRENIANVSEDVVRAMRHVKQEWMRQQQDTQEGNRTPPVTQGQNVVADESVNLPPGTGTHSPISDFLAEPDLPSDAIPAVTPLAWESGISDSEESSRTADGDEDNAANSGQNGILSSFVRRLTSILRFGSPRSVNACVSEALQNENIAGSSLLASGEQEKLQAPDLEDNDAASIPPIEPAHQDESVLSLPSREGPEKERQVETTTQTETPLLESASADSDSPDRDTRPSCHHRILRIKWSSPTSSPAEESAGAGIDVVYSNIGESGEEYAQCCGLDEARQRFPEALMDFLLSRVKWVDANATPAETKPHKPTNTSGKRESLKTAKKVPTTPATVPAKKRRQSNGGKRSSIPSKDTSDTATDKADDLAKDMVQKKGHKLKVSKSDDLAARDTASAGRLRSSLPASRSKNSKLDESEPLKTHSRRKRTQQQSVSSEHRPLKRRKQTEVKKEKGIQKRGNVKKK